MIDNNYFKELLETVSINAMILAFVILVALLLLMVLFAWLELRAIKNSNIYIILCKPLKQKEWIKNG